MTRENKIPFPTKRLYNNPSATTILVGDCPTKELVPTTLPYAQNPNALITYQLVSNW